MTTNDGDFPVEVSVKVSVDLLRDWKYLWSTRLGVEGEAKDPQEILKQAIATETSIWKRKYEQKMRGL